MTKDNMNIVELLQKRDQSYFLCTIAASVLQLFMETYVEGLAARATTTAPRTERRGLIML